MSFIIAMLFIILCITRSIINPLTSLNKQRGRRETASYNLV